MPVDKVFFDVSNVESLPRVDIIYAHQGQDTVMFDTALKNGAKGIVVAGAGNGNVSSAMEVAIKAATERGIPVVMTTKTGAGYVSPKSYAISGGFINTQKARILLQLALETGADMKKITEYFDHQRD